MTCGVITDDSLRALGVPEKNHSAWILKLDVAAAGTAVAVYLSQHYKFLRTRVLLRTMPDTTVLLAAAAGLIAVPAVALMKWSALPPVGDASLLLSINCQLLYITYKTLATCLA